VGGDTISISAILVNPIYMHLKFPVLYDISLPSSLSAAWFHFTHTLATKYFSSLFRGT